MFEMMTKKVKISIKVQGNNFFKNYKVKEYH